MSARKATPAVWGLLAVGVCLALLVIGPVYDANDDPAMVGLLTGRDFGRSFDALFLGHNLSAALIRLYAWLPQVPWHGLLLEAANLLSVFLWASLIAATLPRTADRAAAVAGLLVGYAYLLLRVNFMAAALSLFLSAAAWLWRLQLGESPLRWRQAGLGAAMGLAFVIRPSLWPLMTFFAVPCLAVSLGRLRLRRLLLILAPASVVIAWTLLSGQRWLSVPEHRAQTALNLARSALLDVPHVANGEALAAAGWTETDYALATRFSLYDDVTCTIERISRFLETARTARRLGDFVGTARLYLFTPLHGACLAALACLIVLLRGAPVYRVETSSWSMGRRFLFLVWAWLAAGTIALAVTRYPPRAYVPLYIYFGMLALILQPRPLEGASSRRVAWPLRSAAAGCLVVLLALVLLRCWVAGNAGVERREADCRELDRSVRELGPETILVGVPLSGLYDTVYTRVLGAHFFFSNVRVAPAGWIVTSAVYPRFLRENGFSNGRAFMEALVSDPRVVFAVRRTLFHEATWLTARLAQRYAAGRPLRIEPVANPAPGSRFIFFRLAAESQDGQG